MTNFDKAATLIQALPYIRKFHSKIIIVKYGGAAMESADLKRAVMEDLALLKMVGLLPIIVHGGGRDISAMCERLGLGSEFRGGRRVSDAATTEVAAMMLNFLNKNLVHALQNLGVKAIGLCGKDAGLLECQKQDEELGFVGRITRVNAPVLRELLGSGFLPVIAPVGLSGQADELATFNINADDAALEIAVALGAEKLIFLTDTPGLYENFEDKTSLISRITTTQAQALLPKIDGGMRVKLAACVGACERGVGRVHILDGRVEHSLLLELFTDEGLGTLIEPDPATCSSATNPTATPHCVAQSAATPASPAPTTPTSPTTATTSATPASATPSK